MPRLDPIAVSKMFTDQMPDPNLRSRVLGAQVEVAESLEDQRREDALRRAVLETDDYDEASKQYLNEGGDPNVGLDLRERGEKQKERRRSQRLDDAKIGEAFVGVMRGLPGVTPETYKPWRSQIARYAEMLGEDVSEIPTEYDEAFVAEARERLKPAIEKIGGHEFFRQGNEYSHIKPEKPAERWRALTPPEVAGAGLPAGGAYRINSSGKVETIVSPRSAGGGQQITQAQQANNAEIDAARQAILGLTRDEIIRRTQPQTATGRENPDYDPYLASTVKRALDRKVGDDPDFARITGQFHNPGSQGPAAPANPQAMSDAQLLQSLGIGAP